ncbi:SDR family NAD(P)-dependent oxidoreductase [Saccharopolyspora flava]|uniref:Short-chain dehydrogenase n=1 Tax=Saccharopolyspora flava TaxID=95161 RepID=A0A1I6V8C7_9PSEU|nr:SDR family oxidoreductase [Saccharopolyspora flava]SFT09835.1 Short-chain dehydrogenase [Saccharopolyspora flava]
MELNGARILVIGATGVLGSSVSRAVHAQGARCALAGRDPVRLRELSDELASSPITHFEALNKDSCYGAVTDAAQQLGGLDALIITIGVAAFGTTGETDDVVVESLFAINTRAPIALARAATPYLQDSHGTLATVTAILADYPTPGMAAYSASKAATSAWLTAFRREQRRFHVSVFDIQPPHMETGLADRAIGGQAPPMPRPACVSTVVDQIVLGLSRDARKLATDIKSGQLLLT